MRRANDAQEEALRNVSPAVRARWDSVEILARKARRLFDSLALARDVPTAKRAAMTMLGSSSLVDSVWEDSRGVEVKFSTSEYPVVMDFYRVPQPRVISRDTGPDSSHARLTGMELEAVLTRKALRGGTTIIYDGGIAWLRQSAAAAIWSVLSDTSTQRVDKMMALTNLLLLSQPEWLVANYDACEWNDALGHGGGR
jgi:hypothetical protein